MEYSRGGPSGHLNQNINGGNYFNRDGMYASNNEGDGDRTLTYHEFIAAAMMNRWASLSLSLSILSHAVLCNVMPLLTRILVILP